MKASLSVLASLLLVLPAARSGAQALVSPSGITFSGTAVEFFATEANLINGSGLSATPTIDDYTTVTHAAAGGENAWVTTNPAGAGDFYPVGQTVVFDLPFAQEYRFSSLVFWGYHFGGPNGNEGRRFQMEFSKNGGTTFGSPVTVELPLGTFAVQNARTLGLGANIDANFIRLTVLDNHFGGAPGGDRVGLGELRFIGDVARDPWIGKAPVAGSSDGSPVTVNIPITNQGAASTLNLTAASFSGIDAGFFTVTSSFPVAVAPGQTVNLTASFNPAGFTGTLSAVLGVNSNDPVAPLVSVPVSMSVAIPNAVYPASASFGPVANGAALQDFSVALGNTGNGPLTILDAFFVDGSLDPSLLADFTVTTDFINNGPVEVAPSAQRNITFRFDPSGLKGGVYPCILRVLTDDPDTPTADIPVGVDVSIASGSKLVGWWPLEADSRDASGNGFNGVDTGAINYTVAGAGASTGGAAEFDGASSIDIAFNEALNPSSFTVTLWANPDIATGFNSTVTSRFDGFAAIGRTYGFILYRAGPNWEFWTGEGKTTSNPWSVTGPVAATTGVWVHLAISYNHLTKTKTLYVDGVEVAATPDIVAGRNLLRDLHIGGGGDLGTSFRFDGKIDDVAIFREALDATAINAIKSTGVTGFTGLPLPGGASPGIGITGVSLVGGNIVIGSTSGLVAGQPYHLESSTDLVVFTAIPGSTFAGGGPVPVVPVSGPRLFIRIVEGTGPPA